MSLIDLNNEQNDLSQTRKKVDEEFQPEMTRAMGELKAFATTAVKDWGLETEQLTAMWTKAGELGIRDATQGLLEDYLAEARDALNPDSHYSRGQDWEADTDVEWIWDQWIAKGFFHTITAMQKVGKSTFFLDFIKAICDGNGEYLNFSLFSEKKDLEFVLIGPDMGRRLWGTYGVKSQLLQVNDATKKLRWHEQIAHVFTEEDGYGLGKSHISRYVEIAEEINARGKHPLFVMDSYSAMLSAAGIKASENDSQFANPLRELKLALGRTGATTLMLHHSSITSSKRATEASNSGHQAFNRVPDQLLTLKWLADAGPDGKRSDSRIILSATGRTGASVSPQLLEQSLDWGWSSHGDVNDALKIQIALDERDRLAGDDAIAFDLLNTRTRNGVGTTSTDLAELRESTSNGRGAWSGAKIWRLMKKLERKSLAYADGEQRRPGDFGGTPWKIWWTFERKIEEHDSHDLHSSHDSAKEDSSQEAEQDSGFGSTITTTTCFRTQGQNSKNSEIVQDSQDSQDSHDSDNSAYGENYPALRQMVEDRTGQNSMVVTELMPSSGEVKVQQFGNASAPIKRLRWLVDVFPCGTHAKNNPIAFDDDEIL